MVCGKIHVSTARPNAFCTSIRHIYGAYIICMCMCAFETSPLKEYPPGMCRAIAAALAHDISHAEFGASAEHSSIPNAFLAQCRKMHSRHFGDFIGRD